MTRISTSRPSSSRPATVGKSGFALGSARVRWTGRAEGDLGLTATGPVDDRRRAAHAGPWCFLRQVHGRTVHVVDRPGGVQGAEGDALVSAAPGVALAVFTADCAPVALASPEGIVGVAHAGWRGLELGVIEATVDAMRRLGATDVIGVTGPCIHPCCYEFGPADLDRLVSELGPDVRGRTRSGCPALDLPAAVRVSVDRAGATLVAQHRACTACSAGWYSHRARAETPRQATVVVAP